MLSSFYVASIDLSKMDKSEEVLNAKLLQFNPDIVYFTGVDPYWSNILQSQLSEKYSSSTIKERIDDSGMAIFSRYPLRMEQVLNESTIPIFSFIIQLPYAQQKLRLIAGHLIAVNNQKDLDYYQSQISKIENFIETSDNLPLIIAGKLESTSWERNISKMRKRLKLDGSRRNFIQINLSKVGLLFLKIKKSNIYYNKKLESASFEDINVQRNSIGAIANFQVKR